ncbi:DUF603 domain-containing protein [Borrelia crocidurae]|uniref:Family 115-like protein n=1 Tax=Borrelia crocidurae (strain Achema) TaxID=1155096 RepID=I0FEX0_BORCA|nr:DUF603 domain-containing protein [Borrelia crocidurae]AFI32026.1 Protein of unknown function, DUF603-containing protein [Borrelia crocidurae str. Achema]
MSRVKKSFDDYIVYFNEDKLSYTQISKETGVSRANLCKMRRRWKSREISNLEEQSKVTIKEEINNEYNEEINNKLCELDEVKRAKELKKMELYYQAMRKLKATDFESQVKFKI